MSVNDSHTIHAGHIYRCMFAPSLRKPSVVRLVIPALGLLLWMVTVHAQTAPVAGPASSPKITAARKAEFPLDAGKPVEREMIGKDQHLYRVRLQRAEFLQVRVDQKGIDVILELREKNGRPIAKMDSPNGTEGFEVLSFIAERGGEYLIAVISFDGNAESGRYAIERVGAGLARERERQRVVTERLFMDGMASLAARDESARLTALTKFEAARKGWEELGDAYMAGLTESEIRKLTPLKPLGEANGKQEVFSSKSPVNGRSINVPVKYGERLSFPMQLRKGETLRVEVEEHDVNISLVVAKMRSEQEGDVLAQSHYGNGFELESLTFIAEQEGEYLVMAEPEPEFTVGGGAWYRITPFIREYVTANDRQRVAVERLMLDYLLLTHRAADNHPKEALAKLEQAAPMWREVGDAYWEGFTRYKIGELYENLDDEENALNSYTQALRLFKAVGNKVDEGATMRSLADLYNNLGDSKTALDYFQKAAALFKELGIKRGEAGVLNQSCGSDRLFDTFERKLECYNRALSLYHELEYKPGEALTHNNIGLLFKSKGENDEALKHFEIALSLFKEEGGESTSDAILANIAQIYSERGDKEKTLEIMNQLLGEVMESGDRANEAALYTDLSKDWSSLGKPALAIFYGKMAVNIYQTQRGQISRLDKQLQKSFLQRIENSYRVLIEQLISQDRLKEAQQVFNLLKDQQFFDPNMDKPELHAARTVDLTEKEQTSARELERVREELYTLGKEYLSLKAHEGVKKAVESYEEEESRRIKELEPQLQQALADYKNIQQQIENDLTSLPSGQGVDEVTDTLEMQDTLGLLARQTGKKPVAVYTLMGEENFYALIVSADRVSAISYPIKSDVLNEKALQLWALLQSDKYDTRVLAYEVYSAVFRPLEDKLPAGTDTILWSLDGNLRYLPMAALYDGKRFLIERYTQVVFTRASREQLTRPVSPRWTGLGLGSSDPATVELLGEKIPFGPLLGVKEELRTIFKQRSSPGGVVEGEVLRDKQFTKEAMLSALRQKRPLVHIASHFSFRPGDESRSFLLLGNGTVLTLAEMKSQPNMFMGVELLTLSACNTAAQRADADGREVDGFAELAQRLGADSVLATLWPVADNSTPWLMREFYQTRQAVNGLTKADALRRAQLALLTGNMQTKRLPETQKGTTPSVQIVITANGSGRDGSDTRAEVVHIPAKDAPPFKRDDTKQFAHPYYWAPFILIGNWC